MKTILNSLIILLVASIVAGGFWLAVNNTSIASGPEGGQHPAMTSTDGSLPERPEGRFNHEGGEHSASLGRGLAGVFTTLVKLASITAIVLVLEKGLKMVRNKPAGSPA